jgi:hypothetical protein
VCACVGATVSTQQHPASVVERFLARDEKSPTQYRALRRLDATSKHFGATGWMDAWTDLDAGGGFRYEVAAEGGSGFIRKRVLLAWLEAEQKMMRDREPQRAQVDLTNYTFVDDGVADGVAALIIKPRRNDALLIDGRIFVNPQDGELLRIEGRLTKKPSFWTRKVDITRRYGRLAGVHVPLVLESDAQVFIAGQSSFRMTYEYETINGERVGSPQAREAEKVESSK